MTRIWTQSFDDGEFTRASYLTDIGDHLDVFMSVMACQPLAGQFPDTHVAIESDHLHDYFMVGPLFVVSGVLRAVFEEYKVCAEFHPIRTFWRSVEYTERPYFFCNILESVEAFDMRRGEYTFWAKPGFTDHVDKIAKLAVDESKARGHPLFRIAKGGEYLVCASDELASRIEAVGLTGMRLIEPYVWSFGCG